MEEHSFQITIIERGLDFLLGGHRNPSSATDLIWASGRVVSAWLELLGWDTKGLDLGGLRHPPRARILSGKYTYFSNLAEAAI